MENVKIRVEMLVNQQKGFSESLLVAGNTQQAQGEFSLEEMLSKLRKMQREVRDRVVEQVESLIEKEADKEDAE